MTTEAVLAIDIGGTSAKGAVIDTDGHPVVMRSVPTGEDGSLGAVLELAAALRASARDAGRTVVGLGAGTPGVIDLDAGVVRYAANLGWRDVPLADLLAAAVEAPVRIDHDVRAGGLAEAASAGIPDLAYVSIGTGVAAATVSRGMLLRGATGGAGELGHVMVERGGEVCGCGAVGCLEAYASGGAVERRYARRTGHRREVAAIVARAATDPVARAVWDDATRSLAQGLVALVVVSDPALIVLGGGVSRAGAALLDPVRGHLTDLLPWRAVPEVRLSALAPHSGLLGAALLGLADPARNASFLSVFTESARRAE